MPISDALPWSLPLSSGGKCKNMPAPLQNLRSSGVLVSTRMNEITNTSNAIVENHYYNY